MMIFLWAFLYQLVSIAAKAPTNSLEVPWITCFALLGYTVLLLLWVRSSGKAAQIWLRPVSFRAADMLSLLPLLSVPIWNLLGATKFPFAPNMILWVLSVVFVEEVFFRGFLLAYLLPKGRIWGILLSSILFSLYHGLPVFSAGMSFGTCIQLLFALLAGICFSQLTLRHHSLLPGMILHFLINVTGYYVCIPQPPERYFPGFFLCLLCYMVYALRQTVIRHSTSNP